MTPLLDTHIWIWWVEGARQLSAAHREALDALSERERPLLSIISLWELSLLIQKGRYRPGREVAEWLTLAAGPATVQLAPNTPAIGRELCLLPASFHADPADRLLVATARALDLPLLTYDQRILQSGLVQKWEEAR